jgi:hypothetical protein
VPKRRASLVSGDMAALSSVLASIRARESQGNYNLTPQQNYNYPASHASGAYQFQPATWQQYTQQSGIGTQYAEAYQAPPNVQDAVASYAVMNGPGVNSSALWGASAPAGGYAPVTSVDVTPQSYLADGQVAQGPNVQEGTGTAAPTDPANPGTSGVTGIGGNPMGDQGGMGGGAADQTSTEAAIPGTILYEPATVGLSTGLAQAVDSWIKTAESEVGKAFKNAWAATLGGIENLALRFFLILAGLVVIALALWKLLNPGLEARDIAALARVAA